VRIIREKQATKNVKFEKRRVSKEQKGREDGMHRRMLVKDNSTSSFVYLL